ncbi:helix-turn-helix transcriptional regulator [Labedaea rhizosphaerae]|uniref:HTH domain-containing protein n=1 Tax=Labedaea rhizosphaerae TaxID=598644 RepID=A0A4R6SEL7_LABRH|nr:YafY family protein [Labedaea rhizosphaerae]TDP97496.1 HTH domain-containing protein [Labedaea rhizosphaerae]
MNRTDRLYALVEELRAVAPRPRSAAWLARRFEVSTRTIERDLLALQQSGVPVYAQPGRTGGYVLDRTATLPPLALSPAEATALAVGLRQLTGTPFASAARSALQKVLAVMPGPRLRSAAELAGKVLFVAPEGAAPSMPPAVRDAITDGRVLRLGYVDRHGVTSDRDVEPLGFLGGEPHWYLLAWCRTRSAVRGFRLDRIRSAAALEEPVPPREVDLREIDALGRELVGLDVMPNTDSTVSPRR